MMMTLILFRDFRKILGKGQESFIVFIFDEACSYIIAFAFVEAKHS